MSGERNRRTLAFRGGGLAGLTGSSAGGGGNCNSCEALACQDRQFNGNRPDQEEDRDLGANGTSQKRVEGAGSVSDSTEPEAEEEEDPEGGSGPVGDGEYRLVSGEAEDGSREGDGSTTGNKPGGVDVRESGSGAAETGSRKSGVEMRPQMLLLKHSQFHASWLQEFPWLKFSQETGLMSCSWCRHFATKNSDELVKGSRNYKRALLLRHHLSAEHGRNDPTKQEMVRPSDNASPSTNCSGEDYRNKPNENSYCYQLLQELDKQRKSGILCDVNLVVSGQVFRAHKNILVAGSRYFKTLYCLTKTEAQDQATVTHLDIAAVQGFSVILDFLYSGNLLLTSQNAIEVMSVASYLQMTEVVHSCRAFIKDALNISIKQEAPDSVVVDYNKRQMVAKEGHRGPDNKPSNFWATSILSKLSIKASTNQGKEAADEEDEGCGVKEEASDIEVTVVGGEGCALVTPGSSGSWTHQNDNSSDSAETNETRARGQVQFYVWNEASTGSAAAAPAPTIKREAPDPVAGSGRRKKQATTRRFVYNFPPEPEEGFDEGMFIQPSASYPREDFSSLSENAELANQIQYSIIQDIQQGESWENGESSHLAINKLKCPHCNYIAKHRRTLKRHLIIHSGVRSFSCDICGKLFTRREHVKRHSLVHKKDKKYKCMVCKKIFMLAASVGIRHGSRRYGVCADCADSHQATQEGLEGLEFPRDEDFEGEDGEDLEGEDANDNDQSNWAQGKNGAAREED
ncbi:zinc finger and BTB domain-containing protein 10 isoform X1 [Takifugu flavidus]|uniref:zinc finger and BTB domain-containing protein 10 isoform X1 n=1 Tax=Takifugu flavidus TaxID=433684 RepID=UPI00254444FF|nr:zinc finger and BTB domain-containing protein 10 isoform X1 [Takifugu flavidus]